MSKPGVSSRTAMLLSRAAGAGAGSDADAEVAVRDAETGELCVLNTVCAVDDAGLERPRGARPTAAAGNGPAPTVGNKADAAREVQRMRAEQQTRLLELVGKEAARESLRREVLAAEASAWRRALMKRSFVEERLAAAEELKRVKSDQEIALAARLKQLGLLGR
jgi:hypothetical protein